VCWSCCLRNEATGIGEELVKAGVLLGGAQKVAAHGEDDGHALAGVAGGSAQVADKGVAFLGVFAEGVDFLELVYQQDEVGFGVVFEQAVGDEA